MAHIRQSVLIYSGTPPTLAFTNSLGSPLIIDSTTSIAYYLNGSTVTALAGGSGGVTSVTGTAPIVSSGGTTPAISIADFVASGASHARGAVPDPGASAGTTRFLREDATWAAPTGGTGTVTSVSVTTANGVSGSVATPTTTPAISLTLGAITPTTVTPTAAINEAPTVTLASAATVNIGAASANTILISGTTTITAFDTIAAGAVRRVRFGGILTLTYNAASLILPSSANITTAADDTAEFLSLGAGNWFCLRYDRKSGSALVSGGGLLHWTEAETTASPYSTSASATSFTPNTTAADSVAVLKPKGIGGVQAAIADSAATGGNLRGQNAVDWQTKRLNATQVASGSFSGLLWGQSNTASGSNAAAGGQNAQATGNNSVALGQSVVADGVNSFARGVQTSTRGITGKQVFGSGIFAAVGDAQSGAMTGRAFTTDATPTALTADQSSTSAANIDVMPNTSSYTALFLVNAHKNTTDNAGWVIAALIRRGTGVGSVVVVAQTIIAGPLAGGLFNGAGNTWTPLIVADTTNGGFYVQGTGAAATQISWTEAHFTTETAQ